MQGLQGEARGIGRRRRPDANRNENDLFTVREGNDGAVPAYAGTASVLPGVLPGQAVYGSGVDRRKDPQRKVEIAKWAILKDGPCYFTGAETSQDSRWARDSGVLRRP